MDLKIIEFNTRNWFDPADDREYCRAIITKNRFLTLISPRKENKGWSIERFQYFLGDHPIFERPGSGPGKDVETQKVMLFSLWPIVVHGARSYG